MPTATSILPVKVNKRSKICVIHFDSIFFLTMNVEFGDIQEFEKKRCVCGNTNRWTRPKKIRLSMKQNLLVNVCLQAGQISDTGFSDE